MNAVCLFPCLAFVWAASLSLAETALAPANLLFNPDFAIDDGMGEPAGWSRNNQNNWNRPADWQPAFPVISLDAGEPGAVAIDFVSPEERCVRQKYFSLASGGAFRLSCEVDSSEIDGGSARLELSADNGGGVILRIGIPHTAPGEWRCVEKVFSTPSDWSCGDPAKFGDRHFIFDIAGKSAHGGNAARLRIRNLALKPLDERARSQSAPIPSKYVAPQPRRIVPIAPLLSSIDACGASILLYWPGEPPCGVEACTLRGAVDGGASTEAPLASDGRALLSFGRLAPGDHRAVLSVCDATGAVLATSEYLFTAKAPPPEGPQGERLNNFVTRLHDAPLSNGEVWFFVPSDGWVWFSITGAAASATAALDGEPTPCVRRRDGEIFNEAQRFLATGWHTLGVSGATAGGRLRIHAVKTLVANLPNFTEGPSILVNTAAKPNWGLFTMPFHRRFGGLSTFNTFTHCEADSPARAYFEGRGCRLWGPTPGGGVFVPARHDIAALRRNVASPAWRAGMDVLFDENAMDLHGKWGVPVSRFLSFNYSELLWSMREEMPHGGAVNTYYSDSNFGGYFRDGKCYTSEISAIVNSGDGGFMIPETYVPSMSDETFQSHWEDMFARCVASIHEMVPAARGRVMLWLGPYVNVGHACYHNAPEVDLKAQFSRQLLRYATDPRFADLGGIGFGALRFGSEELRRWGIRIVRHYCLEGATGDLSEEYGFAWTPGIVRNVDFADGLASWRVETGAGNASVRAAAIPGYAKRQQRQCLPSCPQGFGDSVAVLTAGSKPSALSQTLGGLIPGRCYVLEFSVSSFDAASGKMPPGEPPNDPKSPYPAVFSARLDGAVEIKPLSCRRDLAIKGKLAVSNYRYVFRAEAPKCTLVLSDCDDSGATPPSGAMQVVNHISFTPYYLEDEAEINEIAALFADNSETVTNRNP